METGEELSERAACSVPNTQSRVSAKNGQINEKWLAMDARKEAINIAQLWRIGHLYISQGCVIPC